MLQYQRLDILYNRFLILYNWFNVFDHRLIILNYRLFILNNWIIVLYNSPINLRLWFIFLLLRFKRNNVNGAHPRRNTGSNETRVVKTLTILLNPVYNLAPLFLLLIPLLKFHLFAETARLNAKFNLLGLLLLLLLFVNNVLVLLRHEFFIRKNRFFILILLMQIWIKFFKLGNIWIGYFHGYFYRNRAFASLIYDWFFNYSDVAMIWNTTKLIFWLLTKILFLLIRLEQRDDFLLFLHV